MSSLNFNQDIQTVKSKNYRLIFFIGLPGSNKETQIEKISQEYKYSSLNICNLITQEISKDSELGKQLKEYNTNQESIPTELLVSFLTHHISNCESNTVLIDGFPSNLNDALYFEQNVQPIEYIIKFNGTEETLIQNLNELGDNSKTQEELKNIFDKMNKDLNAIDNFYSPYSIIRDIDINNKTIGEINILTKQCLYPTIYSIIGKRYSGKTELSKILEEHMGIKLIDFNTFLSRKDISNHINDNKYIVSSFINELRQMTDIRVLIEDFPQNKEQYTYFIHNCKPFEKIIFLNANNSSCLERLNRIPLDHPNYISSSCLNKLLYEFEQKNNFFDFLKKNSNFVEIDVNNHKILTIKHMIKQLQPYCAYIDVPQEGYAKEELFNKLNEKYGYKEIYLPNIIENAIKRNIIQKNDRGDYSLDLKINLIRKLIYSEKNKKIILSSFPKNMQELTAFENKICYISKYIALAETHNLSNINNEDSIAVYCYKNNILTSLNPKNLNDYKIEECLDMTKDINIVYGPPQTGKTSIAKHLKEKYNYELLDFKELIEKVKKTKIDPENPDSEPEINFQDLIQGLKNYLTNLSQKKKIVIDNIFIPGGADGFLIDTLEKAIEVLNIIGNLRNLYEIEVPEKDLLNMYKAKEGITEEITEEQKAAFEESLEKPNKLLEEIKNHCANVIKVKREENVEKAKKVFDSQYNINFILLKHEYDICLEKSLALFCARNKVLYINVPQLIYNHFYENDAEAKLLEGSYGKKKLKENCKDLNNFDEVVYYKYNPIFFERGLVISLIRDYVGKNSKLIEENGNFVLLSGYLNYDLLQNKDEPFNLPLLEIKSILELGELTSFIQITRNDIKLEEEEKPEQIVVEKKEKKKVEGEEEKQEEEQPQEEEGANKFKPENFAWTNYDGVPRNYIQIIKRYKTFPIKIIEASDTCREELIKALGNHLDNFMNREELKYKGNITVIKINGEVPVETVEGVNKISKFVEGRREVDNLGKGKISKDKGRVGIIYEVL